MIGNLANPFYSQLALGIGEVVEQYGLTVMLVNAGGDHNREARLVADLLSRRVEGIVIAPEGDDHRHLGPGPMHGTPVVFVARPPSGISADCVLVDDFAGTKDATRRLIARGHTNIAFVGLPPTVWSGAERFRGFTAAMAEARLRLNKRYVRYQPSDVMAAERTVRSLLSMAKPPTALFAANNRNMIGALRAASDAGPPIALAGFDDFRAGGHARPAPHRGLLRRRRPGPPGGPPTARAGQCRRRQTARPPGDRAHPGGGVRASRGPVPPLRLAAAPSRRLKEG